ELLQVWNNIEAILARELNDSARQRLVAFLQRLDIPLPVNLPALVMDSERISAVITLLTSPRYFQFFVPLMHTNSTLRAALLYEVEDGPYSSTTLPQRWIQSVEHLLFCAKEKYSH